MARIAAFWSPAVMASDIFLCCITARMAKGAAISAARMTAAQYDKLMTIVELYASNVPQAMAERRLEMARKQPKDATFFAWTGAVERGGLHYYRIQTPGFLIEMDCTQDQGNHVHSVWRDYENDFGLDLLKAHYSASH